MSEFGHHGVMTPDFCIDWWGEGPFFIEIEGKRFRFIDSDRFGPQLSTKHGDPAANPWPATRSPFWRAHRIWKRQGRRLAEDMATCIWDEPKPQLVRRINKHNFMIIEHGEPDGKVIELK